MSGALTQILKEDPRHERPGSKLTVDEFALITLNEEVTSREKRLNLM